MCVPASSLCLRAFIFGGLLGRKGGDDRYVVSCVSVRGKGDGDEVEGGKRRMSSNDYFVSLSNEASVEISNPSGVRKGVFRGRVGVFGEW